MFGRAGVGEKLFRYLVAAFVLITAGTGAYAGGGPRNVLVVVNSRSKTSREIGLYYQKARGIPQKNVLYISCSADEFVSANECENKIRAPIKRCLDNWNSPDPIDYIVLIKGIPLGAYYDTQGPASVTSVLTCLDNPETMGPLISPYGPSAIGGGWAPAPECAWSHSLEFVKGGVAYHFYAVTRLDAYTVDEVKRVIDRSVHPAVDGRYLLDKLGSTSGSYQYANNRLGVGAGSAYDVLVEEGHEAICDTTSTFVSNKTGLMGYFSWGRNDPDYTYPKLVSNSFAPGSVADMYYSFSARTFVKPPDPVDPTDRTRDSLIGDLIERGCCAVGGYVSEPIITTATFPNVLFDRYTKGYNAAESFFMACPELFWKTTVVADPLMAPFATPPEVYIPSGRTLTGTAQIEALAWDESGIAKVDFYLDGALVGTAGQSPFTLTLDTTKYAVGQHVLEAVAYENSPVQTQGTASVEITIENRISTITHISQAFGYNDGQEVSLSGKLVVAGTDIVTGGFYIEEADRSVGLKVLWTGNAAAGDIVNVEGPVTTVANERCVFAYQVTTLSSGNPLPRALYIPLRFAGGSAFNLLTPGAAGSLGLRNFGLVTKVLGRVASSTDGVLVLTDESGRTLKVKAPGVGVYQTGTMLGATGVMACEDSADGLRPVLLVSEPGTVQVFSP